MSDQPGFPGPSNVPQQPPQPFGGPPPQFGSPAPMQPPTHPGFQAGFQSGPPPQQPGFQPGPGYGQQPTAPWGPDFGQTPAPKGSGARTGIVIAVAVAVLGLSVAGWLITRDTQEKAQETLDTLNVTIPDIDEVLSTVPTIPEITIPPLAIPEVTVPVTIPPIVAPTVVDVTVVAETTVPGPATTLPVPPPAVNLFEGTQSADVVAAIATARGASPLRILQVNLYPTYAFAQVQDPNIPANVDEYGWRSGVQDPTPVQLVGGGDLESNLFSDNEVNWAALPGLVGAALAQIPIEGAQVSHINVSRNLPFSPDVQIRVFVTGTRNNGYLDADAQGNIIAVNQS